MEATAPARCPLCDYHFGDHRLTSDDATPFARAFSQEKPGWWSMCTWIWSAGTGRLKHLALMRGSAASRAFAWRNVLGLLFALSLFQATHSGWHVERKPDAAESLQVPRPIGKGWLFVAENRKPIAMANPSGATIYVWWNPAHVIIAGALGLVGALVAAYLVSRLVQGSIEAGHRKAYREEQRMTAAWLYSTAWLAPATVAVVLASLYPLAAFGAQAGWTWLLPEAFFVVPAGVTAGAALVLWWFWLLRLGATVPADTRGRVVFVMAVGVPLIGAFAATGWWVGLRWLYDWLFQQMGLKF